MDRVNNTWRWFIAGLIGLIVFANHYCRDSVGALEIQLENDSGLSSEQYATLNSLFFLPNIFAPLFAGILAQRYGASNTLIGSVAFACIGYVIFFVGIRERSYHEMIMGRSIVGINYEAIDSLPVLIAAPLFKKDWAKLVGILNGFLRLGSVANFLLSPYLYHVGGIELAFSVASAVGILSLPFSIVIKRLEKYSFMYPLNTTEEDEDATNDVGLQLNDISCSNSNDDIKETNGNAVKYKTVEQRDEGSVYSLIHTEKDSNGAEIVPSRDFRDERDREASVNFDDSELDNVITGGDDGGSSGGVHITDGDGEDSTNENSNEDDEKHIFVFHKLSDLYYNFLFCGVFLYGSMVPFWFLGSAYLQTTHGMTVSKADALVLLPECMICFCALPIGIFLDTHQFDLSRRCEYLSISCFCLGVSYTLLANHAITPTAIMILLGLCYACSNCLLWSSITDVLDPKYIGQANGIFSGALNVLPTFLPPYLQMIFPTESSTPGYHLDGSYSTHNSRSSNGVSFANGDLQLLVLAVCAVLASLFALITAKHHSVQLSMWGNLMVYCIMTVLTLTIGLCASSLLS